MTRRSGQNREDQSTRTPPDRCPVRSAQARFRISGSDRVQNPATAHDADRSAGATGGQREPLLRFLRPTGQTLQPLKRGFFPAEPPNNQKKVPNFSTAATR